ncbi:helix-turn-helix domain-containing protein [Planosporangium sp. 12N6]|uniref:helix-turn-helix domain-containing protein n=1 Tax=Planosporangium spinosum TaxID=3402278 RepID=UPI003CFA1A68
MPPSEAPDTTIGDRVAAIRRRRAITQEQLAEAATVSVETIRKLEQNDRTTARVATLNKLARALGVRTSELFGTSGKPAARREVDDDDVALVAIRRALVPARGIGGHVVTAVEPEAPGLDEVREAIWTIDRAYHSDDYATALAALPVLLADAAGALQEADDPDEARRLLSQANQLVATVLIQLRTFDLAHRALDRALDHADAVGDRPLGATAVVSLCWLLLREGRLDEAEQLAISTADAVEPSFARGTTAEFATWGWLMLRGSAAAVRNNRDDRSTELLDAAAAAAARVSGAPGVVLAPGPATVGAFCETTVAMKRVEASVISGHTGRALDLTRAVPTDGRPTSNNRNRHLLDVAYALVDQRRYAEATQTLLRVRQDAPSWLRHQRYGRDIVSSLVKLRKRAVGEELSGLADLVGVDL